MVDDEVTKRMTRKINFRDGETVHLILIRIMTVSVSVATLLWVIQCGLKMVVESKTYTSYAALGFYIGIATILIGILLLIVGLPIMADLLLRFSHKLQEETGILLQACEMKTNCMVIAQIFAAVVTKFLLLWVIYTGFRLATEPRRENRFEVLTVSVGILSIMVGLVYFVIGAGITTELVLALMGRLQRKH